MKHSHWMVVYDIRNTKRLAKVEKIVQSYGWRLQFSVFEVSGDESLIKIVKKDLARVLSDDDFVLIFNICEKDYQRRAFYGKAAANDPMSDTFILL